MCKTEHTGKCSPKSFFQILIENSGITGLKISVKLHSETSILLIVDIV